MKKTLQIGGALLGLLLLLAGGYVLYLQLTYYRIPDHQHLAVKNAQQRVLKVNHAYTATTYNVIGEGGVFLGGFIVPGVQTSLRAISAGTAQLPPIAPETPGELIGKNTVACLNNGAMFGTAAMLDGLADRVEAQLGRPLTVVATGGLAPYILPCCKRRVHYDADLLFHGLALLYRKNQKS